jgi:3-oxoacyl-[acyl-carrier-protein] synthase II
VDPYPVPITGLGIVCGAGTTVKDFWDSLATGRSALGELTMDGFEGRGVFGSAVDDEELEQRIVELDLDFGPERPDRATVLLLVAAKQALAHSGVDLRSVDPARVGLVIGKCQLENGTGSGRPWIHAPCEQAAHILGIAGPRVVVSTACAAGANSLGLARDKLWTGEADIMLAGGVDILSAGTSLGFEAMQALDSEPCSPYSRSHGLNLAEAAAMVVLERYEDADARGASAVAELAGYGLSADAYHATAPDPTGRGAAACVRRALEDAALTPDDVDYVNGHGTGTTANDRMERKLMWSLFRDRSAAVPISSTKSFVGHSLGASGTVEAAACIFACDQQMLPPTLQFVPGASNDLDFVPNASRPAQVDVTVSSNYAFGGNNAAIVVRRANGRRPAANGPLGAAVEITGIGVVSGAGVGLDALRAQFRAGRSTIRPIATFDASQYDTRHASELCALEGKGYATTGDWRHMDDITRQSLVATRLALADAELKPNKAEREALALMLGTSFGPASTSLDFAHAATALAFSQVTLNAPAGKVCQVLGLRGPSTTITTGPVSGSVALSTAIEHVVSGKARHALVVATDEFFEYLLRLRLRQGPLSTDGLALPYDAAHLGAVLGSAAVAVVIEARGSAAERGRAPYCEIVSTFQTSDASAPVDFDERGTCFERAMRGALKRAGVAGDRVDLSVGWAGGYQDDMSEVAAISSVLGPGALVTAPKSLTGDCESASGLLGVVTGALAISEGLVPPTLVGEGRALELDIALVDRPMLDASVSYVMNLDAAHGSGCVATLIGPVTNGA